MTDARPVPSAATPPRHIVSRFTVLLIAAALTCLDFGRSLPAELTDFCSVVGLAGMAIYVSLEYVAYRRAQRAAESLRSTAEQRLTRQVDTTAIAETVVWDVPPAELLSRVAEAAASAKQE